MFRAPIEDGDGLVKIAQGVMQGAAQDGGGRPFDEEVREAVVRAGAEDFGGAVDLGYGGRVGEGIDQAVELSGGFIEKSVVFRAGLHNALGFTASEIDAQQAHIEGRQREEAGAGPVAGSGKFLGKELRAGGLGQEFAEAVAQTFGDELAGDGEWVKGRGRGGSGRSGKAGEAAKVLQESCRRPFGVHADGAEDGDVGRGGIGGEQLCERFVDGGVEVEDGGVKWAGGVLLVAPELVAAGMGFAEDEEGEMGLVFLD